MESSVAHVKICDCDCYISWSLTLEPDFSRYLITQTSYIFIVFQQWYAIKFSYFIYKLFLITFNFLLMSWQMVTIFSHVWFECSRIVGIKVIIGSITQSFDDLRVILLALMCFPKNIDINVSRDQWFHKTITW